MMGIGEPLDNFDETVRFLQLLSAPGEQHWSAPRFRFDMWYCAAYIRACGAGASGNAFNIASCGDGRQKKQDNADKQRRYGIDELLLACRDYFDKTGRRISFEYALIEGKTTPYQMPTTSPNCLSNIWSEGEATFSCKSYSPKQSQGRQGFLEAELLLCVLSASALKLKASLYTPQAWL